MSAEFNFWMKVKTSLLSTLIFLVLTSPITYRFSQSMVGNLFPVLQNGVLTSAGYLFHGILFFLVILSIMMIPRH